MLIAVEAYPAAGEYLVFVQGSHGSRALLAAFIDPLDANQFAIKLASALGASFVPAASETCAVKSRAD